MSTKAKNALIIALILCALAAGLYASGAIYFLLNKTNPSGQVGITTWATYLYHYHDDPHVFKQLKLAAIVGFALPIMLFGWIGHQLTKSRVKLHGEARFANPREVHKTGLLDGKPGIIVGKHSNKIMQLAGQQFVLLAAPTRSGKGVSTVIPNLLAWQSSCVVLDIKLENFLITSKYRAKHGQKVYLFNPFCLGSDDQHLPMQSQSHRYNPYAYISHDHKLRVGELLSIAASMYPLGKDPFFAQRARDLFLGLSLYLLEDDRIKATFGELLRQSSGKGKSLREHINNILAKKNYRPAWDVKVRANLKGEAIRLLVSKCQMSQLDAEVTASKVDKEGYFCCGVAVKKGQAMTLKKLFEKQAGAKAAIIETKAKVTFEDWNGVGEKPLTTDCFDALSRVINLPDRTLGGVIGEFQNPLSIWASPVVDAATTENDFDFRKLRKERITIYVGIPANRLSESKALLNLFYSQLILANTDVLLHSTPEHKHEILLLNDEATAPGKIDILASSNAHIAGYGIRLLTILQSPAQLRANPPEGYGREGAQTLMTNHACQILFTPKRQEDAEEYSRMLGTYTLKTKSKSKSKQRAGHSAGRSESVSDQRRALMLPQELKELPQSQQIVMVERSKPIKCDRIIYYQDKIFTDRLKSVCQPLAKHKKFPEKQTFDAIWGAGQLASDVPKLDFDLHQAQIYQKTREANIEDVHDEKFTDHIASNIVSLSGIDESLFVDEEGNVNEDNVDDLVGAFFECFDAQDNDVDEALADPEHDQEGMPCGGSLEQPTSRKQDGFLLDLSKLDDVMISSKEAANVS